MTMALTPLSTGTLIELLLNKKKFRDFIKTVHAHFYNSPTDHVSALKVYKTIEVFAYKEDFDEETVAEIADISNQMLDTILEEQQQLSDSFLSKDLLANSGFSLKRALQQKLSSVIPKFGNLPYKVLCKCKDKSAHSARMYQNYISLWNYYIQSHEGTKTEGAIVRLFSIAELSLKYYTISKDPDKISTGDTEKLIERASHLIRTLGCKSSSRNLHEKIREFATKVVSPALKAEHEKVKLSRLLFDITTNIATEMDEYLESIAKVVNSADVLGHFKFLADISRGNRIESARSLPPSLSPQSRQQLTSSYVSVMSRVSTAVSSSDPASVLNICRSLLPFLTLQPATSAVCKVLDRLGALLLHVVKNMKENEAEAMSTVEELFSQHLSLLRSENFADEETSRVSWGCLATYSHNTAVNIYNKNLDMNICDKLEEISISVYQRSAEIEASNRATLRSRCKFAAEINYHKRKNYRKALGCLAQSLVHLVMMDSEEETAERLPDSALLWLVIRRDWVAASREECEAVTMWSLVSELAGAEAWVRLKLARLEATWYRGQYSGPADMTQMWVNSFGAVLKNSAERVDKGMAILERTWVFWLGDDIEVNTNIDFGY